MFPSGYSRARFRNCQGRRDHQADVRVVKRGHRSHGRSTINTTIVPRQQAVTLTTLQSLALWGTTDAKVVAGIEDGQQGEQWS